MKFHKTDLISVSGYTQSLREKKEKEKGGIPRFVIWPRYCIIDSGRKCAEQVALDGTKRNPWDHL